MRTHADVVKEASPLKNTYVCSEERTVMHLTVLMCKQKGRAQWTSAPQESCRCRTAHIGK